MSKAGVWSGRVVSAGALLAWCGWLAWRVSAPPRDLVGGAVLLLELVAFAAALVVTAGLWTSVVHRSPYVRRAGRPTPVPIVMAEVLGLDRDFLEPVGRSALGADDTGEIAWARRGLAVLGRADRCSGRDVALREAAWSVVSVDGLRRMMSVVVLVAVLFSGRAPFERPPVVPVALLAGGVVGVSVGHWLLSAGRLRPGRRFVWSMGSVGAGLGDGTSRSGLPIRWMTTMATMVALNLAVALRGLSDRWTHGLGPMAHDARTVAMSASFVLVGAGLLALRTLPNPDLGFYGATKRLEETSARRLALGGTFAFALLGFVVGVLPAEGAS